MALTRTVLPAQSVHARANSNDPFTTTSITLPANALVLIFVNAVAYNDSAVRPSGYTLSNSAGLTQTDVLATGNPVQWGFGIRCWSVTTGGSPVNTTFTAQYTTAENRLLATIDVTVVHYTGADSITATAIGTDADGTGPASLTLPSAPGTADDCIGVCCGVYHAVVDGTGTGMVGSGWTQQTYTTDAGWGYFQLQTRNGSTSAAVAWADVSGGTSSPEEVMLGAVLIKSTTGGGGSGTYDTTTADTTTVADAPDATGGTGGVQLEYVGQRTGGDTSFGSATVSAAASVGAVSGNFELMFYGSAVVSGGTPTHTTPTGWSLGGSVAIPNFGGSLQGRYSVYYRLWTTAPAAATLRSSAVAAHSFSRIAWANPSGAPVLGNISIGVVNPDTTTWVLPAIAIQKTNSLLVAGITQSLGQQGTAPGGMTTRVNTNANGHLVAEEQRTVGDTGTRTVTYPTACDGAYAMAELWSASSTAGGTTYTPAIAETIASASAQGNTKVTTGTLAEAGAAASVQTTSFVATGARTDAGAAADTRTNTAGMGTVNADVLAAADAPAGVLTVLLALQEALAAADAADGTAAAGAVGALDTLAATDTPAAARLAPVGAADAVAGVDAQDTVLASTVAAADTGAALDIAAAVRAAVDAVTADLLAALDSVPQPSAALAAAQADAGDAQAVHAATGSGSILEQADSATSTDSTTAQLEGNVYALDTLAPTDTVAGLATLGVATAEAALALGQGGSSAVQGVAAADAGNADDTTANGNFVALGRVDTLNAQDTADALTSLTAVLAEVMDAVDARPVLAAYVVTTLDAGLLEALHEAVGALYGVVLADALELVVDEQDSSGALSVQVNEQALALDYPALLNITFTLLRVYRFAEQQRTYRFPADGRTYAFGADPRTHRFGSDGTRTFRFPFPGV